MDVRATVERSVLSMLLATVSVGPSVRASESMPPGRYEMTTETGMPHLEENLRYSTTRETRCLARQDLATAFPALGHSSLAGCRLEGETREHAIVSYVLACEGVSGTSGDAVWQVTDRRISGTLRVKLGGKNMTFYQRVTAVFLDQCARDAH